MNPPVVEGPVPSFYIAVNGSEGFGEHETMASAVNATWRRAVEYAPAATPGGRSWLKWLRRRPAKSLYQTGPLLIAISTTAVAVSRPVISTGAGTPIKPRVIVTQVLPETPARVEMRGHGRDMHGVIPAVAVSTAAGPRGRTVDDWDF